MDWEESEALEDYPAHSVRLGCLPRLERPWDPLQVSRHRTSLVPKPSREDASFHRRRSFQGLPALRRRDIASTLRTNRARGQTAQPDFFQPPMACRSERVSSAKRPALQRSNPRIDLAS